MPIGKSNLQRALRINACCYPFMPGAVLLETHSLPSQGIETAPARMPG